MLYPRLYRALRPLLFRLEPEVAHRIVLTSAKLLTRLKAIPELGTSTRPISAMGLAFPNPVGLAAGLDKNGEYLDALGKLGFGFIEIGTITPRPQAGNPRPRLFRLARSQALINRMGFNNDGVERLLENVGRSNYRGILGVNIGKNSDTPIERAAEDYAYCMDKVYARASYIVVNVSSPNTRGLRQLQGARELDSLLARLSRERERLASLYSKRIPLAVKIAPDLDFEDVQEIAALLLAHGVEGVIATNTTVSRHGVERLPHGDEAGGLSGAPLRSRSTAIVRQLAAELRGRVTVIGVGGIMSAADATEKFDAGANLVQLYTGLVYRGPQLIQEISSALETKARDRSDSPCS
jgi:dihydroorotate dehydrogenase